MLVCSKRCRQLHKALLQSFPTSDLQPTGGLPSSLRWAAKHFKIIFANQYQEMVIKISKSCVEVDLEKKVLNLKIYSKIGKMAIFLKWPFCHVGKKHMIALQHFHIGESGLQTLEGWKALP